MNKDKIITKVFVIIFLTIIATPIVLFTLRIKIEPQKNTDRKISLNFKRNFPLRDDLIKVNNYIKTNLLETNPIPDKIIQGKDGWKFVGDNYSNALSESKGFLLFTEKELQILKEKLLDRKQFLKEQNIKYYIAVAPNKLTIYKDKLGITDYCSTTKRKQFETLCQSLDINYIYLGNKFPKTPTEDLYYKTDTHWNFTAGIYAFNEVYTHLAKDFQQHNLKNYNFSDLKPENTGSNIGDLNDVLLLDKNEQFINYGLKEKSKATPLAPKLSIPKNYVFNPLQFESRYKTNNNNLKILVLNDSFFGYFKNYFVENFGESLFIWQHTFRKKMILSEKPDIFFHEIVERDLDTFLDNIESI